MKRSELVANVSKRTDYDDIIVDDILRGIFAEITESLSNNESVSIHGFGKFVARPYGAWKCYNPISKNIEILEPSVQPAFIPGPKLRKELNK